MRILTLENECFLLNNLPDTIEDDIRFSVLDNSDPKNPDFFFVPLIFLESFSAPGCSESGNDLEVLPLTSINDRGFEAFLFNPLSSFKADFATVNIVNFYTDVKWYFPKMKNGQLLTVPITDGPKPLSAFFVKDISRQCEVIEYAELM